MNPTDRYHHRLLKDVRQSMNGKALEEEEVTGTELRSIRGVSHPERASSPQHVKVLIAALVIVWRCLPVDPEHTSASSLFVGQVCIKQFSFSTVLKRPGDFVQLETLEAMLCCHTSSIGFFFLSID